MSWFLGARMELFHLNGLNFAIFLQIIDLNVTREKWYEARRTVHCIRNFNQAFDCKNNRISNLKNNCVVKILIQRIMIKLPLASEETARNPSSEFNLNKGRTP